MTTETIDEREQLANETVKKYMYWSMGAGLIPLPAVDLAAVLAIQLKMVSDLSKQYGLKFSKDAGKAIIASLVGGAAPAVAGGALASVVKSIPVVGQTAGAVTMPALAAASTYAVGRVFIQHFESGGTFLDFDPERVRAYYSEQYEKGKTTASRREEK